MDISSVTSGVIAQTKQQKTGDAIGVQVAKKAMDIQADAATQLISSVSQSTPSESHLGNNVNTHA